MAVYNASGLAYYRHSDSIGSSRLASTPGRTLYFGGAYAPFGEKYAQTGTTDLSFTGMNQDTVSSLYDFQAREYGIQGRWPSLDPAGPAAGDEADPQTWNRYAYALNNPLALVDPMGMETTQSPDQPECPKTPVTMAVAMVAATQEVVVVILRPIRHLSHRSRLHRPIRGLRRHPIRAIRRRCRMIRVRRRRSCGKVGPAQRDPRGLSPRLFHSSLRR
jgi:RHS repeat-associated protein